MTQPNLRRILSDELHARAFHDVDGAGRFIRFVFLIDHDAASFLDYVNAFLRAEESVPITPESKFARVEFDNYAFRFERHTEFLSLSFIQKGRVIRSGLLPEAFDLEAVNLPLEWAKSAPATLFQAIWLEVGAKPPRAVNDAKMLATLDSRAVAANQFSDSAGQLHFAFDIDAAGFSRIALFNSDISAKRMGRAVQRVVELETYRLLALLGFAAVRDNGKRLGEIEDAVGKLTNELAEEIKLPDGKVENLLSTLTAQAADLEEIYSKTSYRMAATKAYESIMADRISGLQLTRLIGFQGVRGFLNRRMTPALDSCHAFSERLAQLSARITRAGDLLQTQTEMIIQRQNRDLLTSINSRANVIIRSGILVL